MAVTAGLPSKLSAPVVALPKALVVPLPVMGLKLTAVSSLVVTKSGTISATGVTVRVSVLVVVWV